MKKLWVGFSAVVVLSFAVLGWTGFRIYQAGAACAGASHHDRRPADYRAR